MIATLFTAGLLLIPSANAFFRLPCARPVLNARVDPIVNPGKASSHSHTIMGSNAIGFNTTFESLRNSECSTCKVKDDKSAYWVPELFFHHDNGDFEAVTHGGMLVYYLQRGASDEKVEAFPDGLRVLAGNPFLRSDPHNQESQAINWRCIDFNNLNVPETPGFGNTNCPDGLRAQVFFPSCWDGVNLDSSDHKSHMAYPDGINNGRCPPTHPKHLISIFYEVWFSVKPFNSQKGSFVLSNGDPTGYGLHGDFMNGWDRSVLSRAVDTCTADSGVIEDCPVFQNENRFYNDAEMDVCSAKNPLPQEKVDPGNLLKNLPGCVAVTNGPANATPLDLVPGCVVGGGNGSAVPVVTSSSAPSSSASQSPASSSSAPASSATGTTSSSPVPSSSSSAPQTSTSPPTAPKLAAALTTTSPASTFTTDLAAVLNILQGTSTVTTSAASSTTTSKSPAPTHTTGDHHCGRAVMPEYPVRRRSRMHRRYGSRLSY